MKQVDYVDLKLASTEALSELAEQQTRELAVLVRDGLEARPAEQKLLTTLAVLGGRLDPSAQQILISSLVSIRESFVGLVGSVCV